MAFKYGLNPRAGVIKAENKVFFVEKVVEKRVLQNGLKEYLIKWKDYSDVYNSWEPESQLDANVIANFERQVSGETMISTFDVNEMDYKRGCCANYDPVDGLDIECTFQKCEKWWHANCLEVNYGYSKREIAIIALPDSVWFCPDHQSPPPPRPAQPAQPTQLPPPPKSVPALAPSVSLVRGSSTVVRINTPKAVGPQSSKTYSCKKCDAVFKSADDLEKHKLSEHQNKEIKERKDYICKNCHTKFPEKEHLDNHAPCGYAAVSVAPNANSSSAKSKSEQNASSHQSHEASSVDEETNFECAFCHEKFVYKRSLDKHMRNHRRPQPYECPECKRRFAYEESLKVHRLVHAKPHDYSVVS